MNKKLYEEYGKIYEDLSDFAPNLFLDEDNMNTRNNSVFNHE